MMPDSWKYHSGLAGREQRWQRVEIIAWTERGATVRATEPGDLPEDQPSMVRLSELYIDDEAEETSTNRSVLTRLRISWWLAVAQVCMWLGWPRGSVAALDYASRAMGEP